MRWDRFFDDLEDQLASEWEAERAALDTEAERLRLSRVGLRVRLRSLAVQDARIALELADGIRLRATLGGVGADWVSAVPVDGVGAALIPIEAIVEVAAPQADLLRSAQPAEAESPLAARRTFGFAVRDLVRRRVRVAVHLVSGRMLHGTIDRAGADHLDLALHDVGAARRNREVSGYRLVPYRSIVRVQVDAAGELRGP
ncbi:hypothetical protein RZO50_08820 [Microbacterium sp. SSW1-59]|uniref:hypothetical protein n=1 Tax=Microbacterium xanthum TaxID=3079794 RepID=UPI002AD56EE3|nr:hypothetical protein [Microbacterium sp. SSW1-59]MDZ8201618.1 hypothetical protein [Microbacterium sp. SSW1-59]